MLLFVLHSIAQHELREALAIYLLMRAHGLRKAAASTDGSPRDGVIAPRPSRDTADSTGSDRNAPSVTGVAAALSGLWSSPSKQAIGPTGDAYGYIEAPFGCVTLAGA